MNGRRNYRNSNNELPIPAREPEAPPESRIELAPPPDIDIAQDHLGTLFTERRRAMGLKIEEIAEDIKLKPDYLRAIEQERFDQLPTPEYARLFIKAYAERLGFNLSEVFALLDVSAPMAVAPPKPKGIVPLTEPVRRSPQPEEGILPAQKTVRGSLVVWGSLALVALAVAIVVWVAKGGKTKQQVAASAAQSAASVAVPTPQPAPDQTEDSLPMTGGTETAEPMNLSLQFSTDTWVLLEADHDTVFSGIIKAGEHIEASAVESFVMSMGHTNGITATINGRTVGPVSAWGRRLNHYIITQDSAQAWLGGKPSSSTTVPSSTTPGLAIDTGMVR